MVAPYAGTKPIPAEREGTAILIPVTNLLERLFGEERRRTKVIPHAFGERAVLKLMYAALIRAAERWRGLRISEFEHRQLRAVREDIDEDFAARNAPATTRPNRIYPATSGLDLRS